MAKVVGPLHSTEARGSVGSLTYNTWRGAATVKTRSGPAGPATGSRLAMLQLGRDASFAWSDLTDDQRATWNAFGNVHQESEWTGQLKRLSGHSWYVRCYVRASILFETPPPMPPAYFPQFTITGMISEPDIAYWELDYSYSPNLFTVHDYIELYLAGPVSAGRQLSLHDAKRIGFTRITDGAWQGDPLPNGWYSCWARNMTDQGLVGPWSTIRFQVDL